MKLKHFALLFLLVFVLSGAGGCGSNDSNSSSSDSGSTLTSGDITINQTLTDATDGGHVITASGDTQSYSHVRISKTGDSDGENADFYGENSAVFATNGAALTITDSIITTDGAHANAVFSYGTGTTVNVKDSVITTKSNNSGGLMTTGGGTMNAENLTIETAGGSSAAIRSDRGGGTVNVNGGSYTSSGTGSPAIYSTADITVSNAHLESQKAQGIVVEGKNSVTLRNSHIVADNNTHNSNNSSNYEAVMIYQSGSGDASEGKGTFSMTGGTITNANGDIFFVNNTTADITLENADITNNDEQGVLFRAEAAGWGTSGSNGGKVNFSAVNQTLDGDFVVDDISALNLYLSGDAILTGAINSADSEGQIYVEISESTWTLTGDSHITSLTCEQDSINLNGHTLYVGGTEYEEGTASSGEAIEFTTDGGNSGGGDNMPTPPDGNGGTPPDSNGGTPPDGNGPNGGGNSGNNDTVSNDTSMTFDSTNYTTGTANGITYRAYSNLVYVANPVNENYQRLSVYIPESYITGGTINGYTASTAPIFMPNGVGGYMAGSISSPSSSTIAQALAKGLVVVSPALRGRNVDNGSAPACIVDYKAAVRYLRANKDRLPAGNTDRIISCGTSAGGAISALLGATGNSSDYDSWLNELGAANATDDIFASVCYCPITNLDNADMAYEWVFGGSSYGTYSEELKANFVDYVNGLGLIFGGTALTLHSDGTGTFREFIEEIYAESAEDAQEDGETISANWITFNGDDATADLSGYASSFGSRQKTAPAFDKFDLSSAENNEFGDKHFTAYGLEHTTANGSMADSAIIKAMNPMNYIGSATTAKYWRIYHGTNDRDTSMAIPAILAVKLENSGCDVELEAKWGQGHGGDYDLDNVFSWIDEICK